MKTPACSLIPAILLMSLAGLLSVGCKQKGYADNSVLNNTSSIEASDDSSQNCPTRSIKGDSTANFLIDNNYANGTNPYYKKDVAMIYYTTNFISYNNPKCGSNFCTVSLMIQNLIGKTFSFSANFNYGGNDTTIKTITVEPNGNTDLGKIFAIHSMSSCESPFVSLNLQGTISYH